VLVEVHALAQMFHLHHQTMRALLETGLIPGRPVKESANLWEVSGSALQQLLQTSEASPESNWRLTYQVRESLQTTLDTLYDLNRGVLERSHGRYPDEVIRPIQAQIGASIDAQSALLVAWDQLIAQLHELEKSPDMPIA
jgi:hypothetical protein